MAIANLWATVPVLTLLYLAGLQGISKELYDAAYVDGANRWKAFIHVTFPLLLPVTLVCLILKTIDAFALFDLVYILTGGGPANSTQVTGYYLYESAFTFLDYGFASAISWMIDRPPHWIPRKINLSHYRNLLFGSGGSGGTLTLSSFLDETSQAVYQSLTVHNREDRDAVLRVRLNLSIRPPKSC